MISGEPTTLSALSQRIRYLVAAGYAELAADQAREMAARVYDEYLQRRVCPYTGQRFFFVCCEDLEW